MVTFTQLVALCCPKVCADENSLWVALLELQRQKKAVVGLHDGEKVAGGGHCYMSSAKQKDNAN